MIGSAVTPSLVVGWYRVDRRTTRLARSHRGPSNLRIEGRQRLLLVCGDANARQDFCDAGPL